MLDQAIAAGLRSAVEEEAILSYLAMESYTTHRHMDRDVVPFPVETKRLPMIDVDQDGGGLLGPPHCAELNDDCERSDRRDTYARLHSELP